MAMPADRARVDEPLAGGSGRVMAMERRQDLEARQAREAEPIFLPPDDAAALLRAASRAIGTLTCALSI